MPTYEYVCESCGYEFEKFQSITAGTLRKCPKCGKMSLKRLIGCGAGVIFKGSGFYETDYRSESYKAGEKSAKGTPDKGDTKKKDESKPKDTGKEPKAEKKPKSGTSNEKKSAKVE